MKKLITNVSTSPWWFLSAAETIERVKSIGLDGRPFRPKLSLLADVPKFVTDCIIDCWDEDPTQRPEFKVIRRYLKPMQVGMYVAIDERLLRCYVDAAVMNRTVVVVQLLNV